MNNMSGNPAFLQAIAELVRLVVNHCLLVVPTFVLITLMVSLAKGFTNSYGVQVDYSPVARGFILMVSLFFYQELLGVISAAIGGFAGLLDQPENVYQNLALLQSSAQPNPTAAASSGSSVTDYIDEAVSFLGSFSLHEMLQSFVLDGIASTARKIVDILRQTLLGFLLVTGPLAISLSVLPGFGGLFMKWFQNYLSVQFWSITLVILDNLAVLFGNLSRSRTAVMTGLSISESAEKIDFILLSIVITLLYFMVPYLTSFFIGQTQGAIFQSKAIGLATAGVSLAGAGGGIGRSVSGSSGGSAWVAGTAVEGASGMGSTMREATESGGRASSFDHHIAVRK